ncbi:MAG: hypothetical protein LUE98_04490 [Tannerellaceae bacterium]|nr:hypothetical protein [Tannerellaceae bacterium]
METKKINLTSPKNYNALTLEQWRILDRLKGKYTSEDAYLTNVFLHFCNLKPLLYAERWRRILGGDSFYKTLCQENRPADCSGVRRRIYILETNLPLPGMAQHSGRNILDER